MKLRFALKIIILGLVLALPALACKLPQRADQGTPGAATASPAASTRVIKQVSTSSVSGAGYPEPQASGIPGPTQASEIPGASQATEAYPGAILQPTLENFAYVGPGTPFPTSTQPATPSPTVGTTPESSLASPTTTATLAQTETVSARLTASPTSGQTVAPSPTPTLSPTLPSQPTGTPSPTVTPLVTATPTITLIPTATSISLPPWVASGLQATDPATVQLSSGKIQLVMFFAFWDGQSQAMAPLIHGLQVDYQDRMNFIYLDIDDPATDLLKQALHFRIPPHFFLLDRQGQVLDQWTGYVTVEALTQAIESALQ